MSLQPFTQPTGLERIAALETEMRAVQEHLREMKDTLKAMESLLLQGRGAVRIAHWLIGAAGVFGAGWAGHASIAAFLKWAGS